MIYVGIANVISLLKEETYDNYYNQVPNWRKEKANRLKKKEDKARSVGAWILLMQMQQKLGWKEIGTYNLSHSGDYAMCVITEKEDAFLGCDLEKVGEWKPQVVEHFFCESEKKMFQLCKDETEKKDLFYRFWVFKESFMKATRLGMKLPMKSFEILFDERGNPRVGKRPKEFQKECYLTECCMNEQPYKAAVCSEDKEISMYLETEL